MKNAPLSSSTLSLTPHALPKPPLLRALEGRQSPAVTAADDTVAPAPSDDTAKRARESVALVKPTQVPRGLRLTLTLPSAINGVGPSFVPYQSVTTDKAHLSKMLAAGELLPSTVQVKTTDRGEHNIHTHGFEIRRLPDGFNRVLEALGSRASQLSREFGLSQRERFREKLVPLMRTWGRLQGFGEYTVAVPIDAVLRDTGGSSAFGAVGLAHADFPAGKEQALLAAFEDQWKPKVEVAMQLKLTSREYRNLDLVGVFNLWAPTCPTVTRDHLAMMDATSLQPGHAQIYTAARRSGQGFEAQLIKHHPAHEWFVMPGMTRGDCIIFKSRWTGHTSMGLPNDHGDNRTSVETRLLYFKIGKKAYEQLQERWDLQRQTESLLGHAENKRIIYQMLTQKWAREVQERAAPLPGGALSGSTTPVSVQT
jgi:hypothetical protein